jgi:hypothetical protein
MAGKREPLGDEAEARPEWRGVEEGLFRHLKADKETV